MPLVMGRCMVQALHRRVRGIILLAAQARVNVVCLQEAWTMVRSWPSAPARHGIPHRIIDRCVASHFASG